MGRTNRRYATRHALIGTETSRRNKIAILAQCAADRDEVEWKWQGDPYNSRLMIKWGRSGIFECCRSYDEDVKPFLKDK